MKKNTNNKKKINTMQRLKKLEAFDRNYLSDTISLIAGVDEAGRGPLAGPVCVAAVIMPLDKKHMVEGVFDSKQLTSTKREQLYEEIVEKAITYHIEFVDENVIDEINILNATKLGMQNCLEKLLITPHLALIDAVKIPSKMESKSIIKGDEKSYNIACASILAKVARDRKMQELNEIYPQYNFGKHKGYATKEHIANLKKFGACNIHRQSFLKNFISTIPKVG